MELLTMSKKELSRVEVMERIKAKKMTQKKASEALGLSVRHVRRPGEETETHTPALGRTFTSRLAISRITSSFAVGGSPSWAEIGY